MYGEVVDHRNGTYSVTLLLPWEGQAQVFKLSTGVLNLLLSTPVRLCRFLKNTESLHSHVATITGTLKDQDPIKLGSVK